MVPVADPVRRPVALHAGAALLVAAALPGPVVAGLTLTGFEPRAGRLADGLPPALTALGHRPVPAGALAGVLVALTLAHLAAAVLTWAGRPRARTAAAATTGCGVVALLLVLLSGSPQPARLTVGAFVVAAALIGVVLCYQPRVDRYLVATDGYGQAR